MTPIPEEKSYRQFVIGKISYALNHTPFMNPSYALAKETIQRLMKEPFLTREWKEYSKESLKGETQ